MIKNFTSVPIKYFLTYQINSRVSSNRHTCLMNFESHPVISSSKYQSNKALRVRKVKGNFNVMELIGDIVEENFGGSLISEKVGPKDLC